MPLVIIIYMLIYKKTGLLHNYINIRNSHKNTQNKALKYNHTIFLMEC